MKKITLILLTSLFSFLSFGQLQDFEGTFPPSGWAVFDNGIGLAQSWGVTNVATNVYAGSQSAFLNRENVSTGQAEDWLVMPFTTMPNNAQLRFWTRQTLAGNQGSVYTIRVSTTSQTTASSFTTIQTWTETDMNTTYNVYEEKVVSLSAYPAGTQLYIAFVMTNDNGDRWLVDNVNVLEQCLDPTTLTATNLGLTTATLGWTNVGSAPQFQVEVIPPAGTQTGVPTATVSTNSYNATGLTPASGYQFYVRSLCSNGATSEWVGPFNFNTKSPGETCNAPIEITSIPYTTTGTTAGFGDDYNGSPGATGCSTTAGYLNGDDIFYSFTPTTNTPLTITSLTNTTWSGLFVYTSCANVGLSCVAGSTAGNGTTTPDSVIFTPVANQTYYVAISTFAAPQTANFTLTIIENTCTNMTATFGTASNCASGTDSFFVTANVTNMGSASSIVGVTNPVSTTETITAAGTMQFGPFPNGTNVTINLQNATDANCFRNSSVLTQQFCPATNNLCSGAIALTCGSAQTQTTVGATTTGAPTTTCGTGPGAGGLWYTYAGNGDVVTFSLCGSTYNTKLQVLTGSCGTFTCVAGNDDFAGCGTQSQVQVTTLPGVTYYVYVFGAGTAQGVFTLNTTCITPPPPPANDNCATATVAPVNTDGTCTLITPGTVSGATPSTQTNTCAGTADDDVWYQFTATQSTHTIDLQNVLGSNTDLNHAVYTSTNTADLCGTLTQVFCSNPNFSVVTGLTAGQIYFIRIYTAVGIPLQDTTFNLCISVPPPPPVNDECANATIVPVNAANNCTLTVSGTVTSSSASPEPNACGGTDDDDVWYEFTATNSSHIISLINVYGTVTDLNFVLYSGDCTSLTQVICNATTDTSTVNNLVPGTEYKIRIYSATATPNQFVNFTLCVGSPPLSVDNTTYTVPQLITDVLINSPCAQVSNVTWKTGNTNGFGSTNGIAYFQENAPGLLPFGNGIVMTSGDAMRVSGPNSVVLSDGNQAWTGDTDLEAIILAATGQAMNSRNASVIEFDFVPLTNAISFDFMFASDEYGTFQCSFSDSFAFILTNTTAGTTPQNLALVPGTTTPISVVTVRDTQYNTGCASVNPTFFDVFNGGANAPFAATNFNGQTVMFTAASAVIPNNVYHIKMVVADRSDNAYDSAVFLRANSFDVGNIELPEDYLEATGNALCLGESYVIDSELDPAEYTFTWNDSAGVIPGETGPTLLVDEEGTYTVNASFIGSTCVASDSITIEFYDDFILSPALNLVDCNATGYATFDLTQNNSVMLNGLDSTLYNITYHLSQSDAENTLLPINPANAYTNTVQFNQQIWVRVENISSGCFKVLSFNLIVQDLTPQFNITPDFGLCDDQTGTITVNPINYVDADVTYTWTQGSTTLPDTTNSITVSLPETYTVTVNNSGCLATQTIIVSYVPPSIVPTFTPISSICKDLPASVLPLQSNDTTPITGVWSPATIDTSVVGTVTYTFTPDAAQCALPTTMDITIDAPSITPTFVPIANICQDTAAPGLPSQSTNTTPITGVWSPATIDTSVVGTVTYTFTPDAAQCALPTTMDITIDAPSITPTFVPIANICQDTAAPGLPSQSTNTTPITGVWSPATIDTSVSGTVTYTFTPNVAQCALPTTMDVTIIATPVADIIASSSHCDSYILPSLSANNAYYTGSNGGGTMLLAGAEITTTQTIYILASSGTTPNCTAESNFTVTITDSPELTLDGGCEGASYLIHATVVGGEVVTYQWYNNSGLIAGATDATLLVSQDGTYSCIVTLASGSSCESTQEFYTANGTLCTIQKGISPNGDGSNENFDLIGLNVRKLHIYNRYGVEVYSYSNYTNQWYGQSDSGEELPSGTYYYVIDREGQSSKSGWIYINR